MVKFNKIHLLFLVVSFYCFEALCASYSLEECRQKAEKGLAEAQWQMGVRYENGDGVKKNAMRAIAMYKKAAEQKHRRACEKLSNLYEEGRMVKKDAVLAAKYKAWSLGGDGETAASQAREREEIKNVDEIEIALDYILGRNGKPKDPKTGIRILYSQAKDKPLAQRVFVDRWSKGDLDDGLEMLNNEEWSLIIPWFEEAWRRGNYKTGLVLGNDAYRKKKYFNAILYWEKSGFSKALYFVGRFYDRWAEEGEGGGPSYMRDETKARIAYERCLRIDKSNDDAKYLLGIIYLFPERSENKKLAEARNIFSYLITKMPDDKWVNWFWGVSGFWLESEIFDKKYPEDKIKEFQAFKDICIDKNESVIYNQSYEKYRLSYRSSYNYRMMAKKYEKYKKDLAQVNKSLEHYLEFIRKAARLGCEPAQKFLDGLEEK